MNRFVTIIGFLLISLSSASGSLFFNAPAGDFQKDISDAIRSGNSVALGRFFSTNLDLSLPGNENTYSKAQAEIILRDFFLKNPPLSFVVNHNGSSKDGSVYFIGTYKSKQNKSFRTYCLVKKSGDKYLIQQLQFEAE